MTKSERRLFEMLAKRYPAPGYALLPQVPDATGIAQRRTIDALAMQLWPSRGLTLTAFEFKASRSDWLKELRTPDKADGITQQVHEFYVVAEPKAVDKGEVPKTWGFIERKGARLYTIKKAPWKEVEPPDFLFLASIMRQLHNSLEGVTRDYVHRNAIQAELDEAKEEAKRELKFELRDAERLHERVVEFEKTSGINIRHAWNLGLVGEAVSVIVRAGVNFGGRIKEARTMLQAEVEAMDRLLEKLNGEKPRR